jgi:hypothetical protein
MRFSLIDMTYRRLIICAAVLTVLLCLLLSACGAAPGSSTPAQVSTAAQVRNTP